MDAESKSMPVSIFIQIHKQICPSMDVQLQAQLCINVYLNSAANLFKHGFGDQTQLLYQLIFKCISKSV